MLFIFLAPIKALDITDENGSNLNPGAGLPSGNGDWHTSFVGLKVTIVDSNGNIQQNSKIFVNWAGTESGTVASFNDNSGAKFNLSAIDWKKRDNLENVTIPSTIKKIDSGHAPFEDCVNLKEFLYQGTEFTPTDLLGSDYQEKMFEINFIRK